MVKKIQIIGLVILAIAVTIVGVLIKGQANIGEELKNEKDNIAYVDKEKYDSVMTQDEAKEYKKLTEDKLDSFLKHKYNDDQNEDGSAYQVLRAIFTVQSHKIVLTDKSSESDFLKYYSPFEYDISNFSAVKNGDNVEVMFNISTEYDGKPINERTDLVKLNYNADGKLNGGTLYEK
ncbi:hypothetical protein BU107_04690 [Staphylococcus xylosus]|uniref:hypothetical protein n=1 Tax=Staphylococcus xylosus TaxID=1288 RepID=UPI000E677636|nr:hypothetical protein [Staphylococcus xylosus]RIM88904.1 hypothetical protein BU107_04690 [Staphylococcus xylosus]